MTQLVPLIVRYYRLSVGLGGSVVKNQPANAGDAGLTSGSGRFSGGEGTHSSIPAWEIPRTEEPGGLQSTGLQSQRRLSTHTHARMPFICTPSHSALLYYPSYYRPLEDTYFFLSAILLDIGLH